MDKERKKKEHCVEIDETACYACGIDGGSWIESLWLLELLIVKARR